MSRRPRIGICIDFRRAEKKVWDSKGRTEVRTPAQYVDAVARAGGLPLLLPPCEPLDLVREMLDAADGVLLTGGADVDPARYGQAPHATVVPLDPRREAFDLAVAELAAEIRKPLLAICLGIQVVNVARGGTLIQDLATQRPDLGLHRTSIDEPDPIHVVHVGPGTLLASIVGRGPLEVNSSHHQAVDAVGRGLAASARTPDGLVEALEDPGLSFFLAVQWHPERVLDRRGQLALFEGLVRAAGG